MKATFDGTVLADETPARAMTGFALNGRQVVQEEQFIRAAQATLFARGNRTLRFSFSVTHTFGTIAEAETFALTHYANLADGPATLVFQCGTASEAVSEVYITGAVLENVSNHYVGTCVTFTYAFAGSAITAIVPVTEEEDMPSRSFSIPSGVDTFPVTGQAWPSIPVRVLPHVRIPADGDNIEAHVVDGTITADGFTIQLTGVTPAVGYYLDYNYQL